MNSSTATRKVVKNYLLNLRKKRNNEAKLLKNTFFGIGGWSEKNCDSNDAEDLEEDNKLTAHQIIKCNSEAMILIATKRMLKLLQNETIQLRSDTTHGLV